MYVPIIPMTTVNPHVEQISALQFSLLYLISKSISKTFCSTNAPTLDRKPKPPHSLVSSGVTVPFGTSFPPTISVGLVTNTSFDPLPAFNSASFTMACSGCGGLNVVFWFSSCSSSTSLPDAAATNPRNGGEGFRGRVQNSGCAWRPIK